jgi:hypothetical protein
MVGLMVRIECPPACPDAPFPHFEVITRGGRKFILCADCGHDTNRERSNCKCPELCHFSDLVETDS